MRFFHKGAGGEAWRATIWYTAASLFTKAFGFLTIPLYTNLLTTAEYGYLNTYNAWISILSVVLGLSLSSAVIQVQNENRAVRDAYQSSVLGLSLVSFLLMGSVILLAAFCLGGGINGLLVLALIQSYATFVMNFILQELVLDNRYVKYSLLSVISAVIPILITCAMIQYLFLDRRYLDVILPRAAVALVIMAWVMAAVFGRGKLFFNRQYWKKSLAYCVPIVFHTLALSVMLQADRIMISWFRGYEEAGIYSFIYNVTLVIGVVVAALENTWKTWFFRSVNEISMDRIRERAATYILCGEAGILSFVYLSPEFIRLLANQAYWQSAYLTAPIAFAYLFSVFYDFLVYYEYHRNATGKIASASIAAAAVNIALNGLFIPSWGAAGAAIATVMARFVQFLLHLRTVHRLEPKAFPFRMYLPFLWRSAGMTAAFLLLYPWPFLRWAALAVYLGSRWKGIKSFFAV